MTCHRLQFMCNIKMRKIIKRCEIPQAAEPEGDALSQLPPDRDGRDGLLHGQMLSGGFSFSTAGALIVVTVKGVSHPIGCYIRKLSKQCTRAP